MDYTTPLTPRIPAWGEGGQDRVGFGSLFGSGAFGFDAGGAGFGLGGFGTGLFGFGMPAMETIGPAKLDGLYEFAMVGFDVADNADVAGDRLTRTVRLAGEPVPPGTPTADAWDNDTGTLTLGWTLSTDDEG